MSGTSTTAKVQAKIQWHQSEIQRLQDFLKTLAEFETEDSGRLSRSVLVEVKTPRPHRFKGKGVVDGAVKLLVESPKHALDTHAITDALRAGGMETDSKDFYNTVHALMHRESKKPTARVRRDGKLWRLTALVPI